MLRGKAIGDICPHQFSAFTRPKALAGHAECVAHILCELDRREVHFQCENDQEIYLSAIPLPPL